MLSHLQKVEQSERCPSYRNVPREELATAVGEFYQRCGEWLLGRTETDIRQRFEKIGARRAEQQVPISELIWCIALVKENLWEYLRGGSEEENTSEVSANWKCCSCWSSFSIMPYISPLSVMSGR